MINSELDEIAEGEQLSEFGNPNKVSLTQLQFKLAPCNGVVKIIPALDPYWVNRTHFTEYITLMCSNGSFKKGEELKEWLFIANNFDADIEYLLALRHHEFWSYMKYQKAALASIISFLANANPFYLGFDDDMEAVSEIYHKILNNIMFIICRLVTNKESEESWIAIEDLRQLLYADEIITVPMVFDMLLTVGNADIENIALLRKILDTLLQIEPAYKQEIRDALSFYDYNFDNIHTQADKENFKYDENAVTPFDELVLYILDCAYSLSVLLDVYLEMREYCGKINLAKSIAKFYDTTIPIVYTKICSINDLAPSLVWLNRARIQCIEAFRSIVYHYVEAAENSENSIAPASEYVAVLTECLSERLFVIDYQRFYPVDVDVQILKQCCKEVDNLKIDFVMDAYQKESTTEEWGAMDNIALMEQLDLSDNDSSVNDADIDDAAEDLDFGPSCSSAARQTNDAVDIDENYDIDGGGAGISEIDYQVEIVLGVLPDLGTGFIRRLLSRYNNNAEDAIAALLEENLPPDMADADRSEPYIPPDPLDQLYAETGIKHFNIYDGDQYDVMTQDNPNCIIKRGKGFPDEPKNFDELLNDKSDIKQLKQRYQQYSLVSEGEDEYDDEYNDSYEALLETESRNVKSKVLRKGLANVEDLSDDDETEDEQEGEVANSGKEISGEIDKEAASTSSNNRLQFCENPEEVRARYEAKRQAKFNNKRGGGGGATMNKTHDVVGAPKGQGQDKETLRNRNKKEVKKSSRANHNRKQGASFKRSRGMIP